MIYEENILTDCGPKHLASLLHLGLRWTINNIPTRFKKKSEEEDEEREREREKRYLDYKNVVCRFGSSKSVL